MPGKLMGLTGLEPVTSRLSGVRSDQLSYRPKPTTTSQDHRRTRVTDHRLALSTHRDDASIKYDGMLFEKQQKTPKQSTEKLLH